MGTHTAFFKCKLPKALIARQRMPATTWLEASDAKFNELCTLLENQLRSLGLPNGTIRVEATIVPANMPDTDPQTIYIHDPSLYDTKEYIPDNVKIEVSVRSRRIPFERVPIESLLNEKNPRTVYMEILFLVEAVEPHKTFIEQIFLLNEEFG